MESPQSAESSLDPFDILAALTPQEILDLQQYATSDELKQWDSLFAPTADDIESQGWSKWLKTIGPATFTASFADFHAELWEWYWPITQKRLKGEPLSIDDLVVLYILGRGNGKSSHVEWACIAEGALLGKGYVMYVCATESQAKDHVSAIKTRLESSQVTRYYPGLAEPGIGRHGFRKGWSQEYLATKSGWGIIPVGLKEGIRGGRQDDMRFSLIVLDDIDDFNDSPAVVETKLNAISRGILPAGTADTVVLFPQNLIHENSVLNQILTRRSDVLSVRKVIGPYATFDELDLELIDAEDGRRWEIKHCRPHWDAFDLLTARKHLSKYGKPSFLAEFQHDFEAAREGRVLRNWSDSLMVITKSDFARVFGSWEAVDLFNKWVGHDFARTKSAFHAPVMGKLAVSNQNTKLPGKLFLFDLMTFEAGTQVDDMAQRMLGSISLGPLGAQYNRVSWAELIEASLSRVGLEAYITDLTKLMKARRDHLAQVVQPLVAPVLQSLRYQGFSGSHDQNNDGLEVMRTAYGLPWKPVNPGETGGLEWADHYMTVDRTTPHPFFDDERLADGKWKLGCPGFFVVVDDSMSRKPSQSSPELLQDSDFWRFCFDHWRMRPVKLSESGAVEFGPMKMWDDPGQCLQMILFGNPLASVPLVHDEKVQIATAPGFTHAELAAREDLTSEQKAMSEWLARAQAEAAVAPKVTEYDEYGQPIPKKSSRWGRINNPADKMPF